MRKLVYLSGCLSVSATSMGILFKAMHWPGANILTVIGISTIALVFAPSFFTYKYKQKA